MSDKLNKAMQNLFAAVISCMITATAAQAQPWLHTPGLLPGESASVQLAQQRTISPSEAVRRAQQRHGGRVLSVELRGSGENAYYEVKLIKDGVVRVVRIRATG